MILEIEGVLVETKQEEDGTLMMQQKIKMIEMSYSQNKEDKDRLNALKQEMKQVEEDIQLAGMTKDEAHECLLRKLFDVQYQTKKMEEKPSKLDTELYSLLKKQKEKLTELRTKPTQDLATNIFETKREMKQYLEEWPEN